MKKIACLFVLLLASPLLRAAPWLENGDFSNGNDHWYGPAKWPSDFAPPDPFTKPDPLTSQGMIIPLRSSGWLKICQDFRGKTSNGILTISYVVSPDFAFSQKPEDYQNMPHKIGFDGWQAFDAPVNSWVAFISDIAGGKCRYFFIQPETGSTKEQTFQGSLSDVTPYSTKTIALAIPPGQGMIVIHSVQIDDK